MTDEQAKEWLLGILENECNAPLLVLALLSSKSTGELFAATISFLYDKGPDGRPAEVARQIDTITFKALSK